MSLVNVKSMQSSIDVIQTSLSAIKKFLSIVQTENNEVNLEQKYPGETAVIKDRIKTLQKAWEQLAKKFSIKNHDILNQHNIKQFWYDLTQFEIWLTKIKIGILSEEDPKTLHESEKLLTKQDCVIYEIAKFKAEYSRILTVGERLTAAALIAEDPEYYILKQRVQDLQKNWNEIACICSNRKQLLTKSRNDFFSSKDKKSILVQTDPIPSLSSKLTEHSMSKNMEYSRPTEMVIGDITSTTSSKLEEIVCAEEIISNAGLKAPDSNSEKKGIFGNKYNVPRKPRRGSNHQLSKQPSLQTDLSSPRKRDSSQERICKLTYNSNFNLKESQNDCSKDSKNEFDMAKCLQTAEKNNKFENKEIETDYKIHNTLNTFDPQKPSKLPFRTN